LNLEAAGVLKKEPGTGRWGVAGKAILRCALDSEQHLLSMSGAATVLRLEEIHKERDDQNEVGDGMRRANLSRSSWAMSRSMPVSSRFREKTRSSQNYSRFQVPASPKAAEQCT